MAPDRTQFYPGTKYQPSWKRYQNRLNRRQATPPVRWRVLVYALIVVLVLGVLWFSFGRTKPGRQTSFFSEGKRRLIVVTGQSPTLKGPVDILAKNDVRIFLGKRSMTNLMEQSLYFDYNGFIYRVDTSLDLPLQRFLGEKLRQSKARAAGVVALDAESGQILAMVSHHKIDPDLNVCIESQFPAASVFKIVTAAAVIEKRGYRADTPLKFNGGKYTLYKKQLNPKTNRYTQRISLKNAFAQSVNPVFGRLGQTELGPAALETYAAAFGFNRDIDFEVPLTTSRMLLTEVPYQWAEVASGFNRLTTITPLHGALIAATIINRGKLVEPTIVDLIIDENHKTLYRHQPVAVHQALKPETARVMTQLMAATISAGTGRRIFKGYKKDPILKQLDIGGKTGTIDNSTHVLRYDWFVAYAAEKVGDRKIAVGALVAHENLIGTRAGTYVRMAIKEYFRRPR